MSSDRLRLGQKLEMVMVRESGWVRVMKKGF